MPSKRTRSYTMSKEALEIVDTLSHDIPASQAVSQAIEQWYMFVADMSPEWLTWPYCEAIDYIYNGVIGTGYYDVDSFVKHTCDQLINLRLINKCMLDAKKVLPNMQSIENHLQCHAIILYSHMVVNSSLESI